MFVSRLVYMAKDRQDKDAMTFRGEEKTASGANMSKLFIVTEDSNNLARAIMERLGDEKQHGPEGKCWHLVTMVESYIPPARPQTLLEPGDRLVDFVYIGDAGPELLHRGWLRHVEYSRYLAILYQ